MSFLKSKLDAIFSDPDSAELFAEFEIKRQRVKLSSQVERSFDEISAFFEREHREPSASAVDEQELRLAHRLQAYRNSPKLKEKVKHLDPFGLLNGIPPELNLLSSAISSALTQYSAIGAQIALLSATPVEKRHMVSLNALSELVSVWYKQLSDDLALLIKAGFNEKPDNTQVTSESILAIESPLDSEEVEDFSESQPLNHNPHIGDQVTGEVVPALAQEESPSLNDIFEDDLFSEFSELGEPEMSDVSKLKGGWRRDDNDSAQRQLCESFEHFRARLEEIDAGLRQGTIVTSNNRSGILSEDDMFLWAGLIAIFSGEKIEDHKTKGMRRHVVFSNGTEGWLKESTIVRSMHDYTYMNKKAECKRLSRVTSKVLPGSEHTDATVSGYLYIARTTSDKEELAPYKDHMIKIGCTKNPVGTRLNNAVNDATFLFAPAELLHSFELKGLEPMKVEQVLHAFFGAVRMNITLQDRFEKPVSVNEWFLLNPSLVEDALALLLLEQLNHHQFDQDAGKIIRA